MSRPSLTAGLTLTLTLTFSLTLTLTLNPALAHRRAIDEAWEAREAVSASHTDVLDAAARERRATPPPLAPDALRQVFARAQDEERGPLDVGRCGEIWGDMPRLDARDTGPAVRCTQPHRRRSPPSLPQLACCSVLQEHDGHSAGFFDGPRHQTFVRGLSPSHRGVCAGTVVAAPRKNTVRISRRAELRSVQPRHRGTRHSHPPHPPPCLC